MLPLSIQSTIEQYLDTRLINISPIAGGDINHAAKITFENSSTYFLKWNEHAPESMFATEAQGLTLLANHSAFIVPKVIVQGESFLVLNLINEGRAESNSAFEFGIQLANMHQQSSDMFGLDHDNFIGRLPQGNTKHNSWSDFFISERIKPQVALGFDNGIFPRSLLLSVDQLYATVEKLFPEEPPALLHGDLWSGNYMFTEGGNTCIYDPAVYYGHREMDIAMTCLFGGFSPDFYKGYQSKYPLKQGWENRLALCNLYPLLVHANLFGGSYINQVTSLFTRYA